MKAEDELSDGAGHCVEGMRESQRAVLGTGTVIPCRRCIVIVRVIEVSDADRGRWE